MGISTVHGHSNWIRAQCCPEGDWKEEEGTQPSMVRSDDILTPRDQAKEDASELVSQKADIEKRKKEAEDIAAQKELERDRKIRPIGNYVHESVPVSNNEVSSDIQDH
jgi:seryl-tRNA synthetase